MNNIEANVSRRFLAVAMVIMMLATSVFLLPADATVSEYSEGPYTVNLFEDTRYEYEPQVNITDVGTVRFSVTDPNNIQNLCTGLNTDHLTMTFVAPAENKVYKEITIKASWTLDSGMEPVEALQKIIFKTYQKPYFEADGQKFSSISVPVLESIQQDDVIKTISLTGTNTTVSDVVIKDSQGRVSTDLRADIGSQSRVVTIRSNTDSLHDGDSYHITITGSSVVGTDDVRDGTYYQKAATCNVTCSVEVNVGATAAIYPSTFTAAYNEDDDPSDSEKKTVRAISYYPDNIQNPVLFIRGSSNTAVVANGSITGNSLVIKTGTKVEEPVTFIITLIGTLNGEPFSQSLNATVNLIDDSHMVPPTMEDISMYYNVDRFHVILNTDAEGADYAVIDWGHGPTQRVEANSEGKIQAITHSYPADVKSLYQVTVTVYNGTGSKSLSIGYSTETGMPTDQPVAKLKAVNETAYGDPVVRVSADPYINVAAFKWVKVVGDSRTVLGTSSSVLIPKGDWDAGTSYVLEITNSAGDKRTYSFDKNTFGGDTPAEPASKGWFGDNLLSIAILALVVLVSSMIAIFYFGIMVIPMYILAAVSAVVMVVSTSGLLNLIVL